MLERRRAEAFYRLLYLLDTARVVEVKSCAGSCIDSVAVRGEKLVVVIRDACSRSPADAASSLLDWMARPKASRLLASGALAGLVSAAIMAVAVLLGGDAAGLAAAAAGAAFAAELLAKPGRRRKEGEAGRGAASPPRALVERVEVLLSALCTGCARGVPAGWRCRSRDGTVVLSRGA